MIDAFLPSTQLEKIMYESGIDVAPWINVASGKFVKKNKHLKMRKLI